MSLDAGRLHHRDVTAPTRDTRAVTPDVTAERVLDLGEGDPIVMALRRRLRELEADLETEKQKVEREHERAERYRAWLVEIRFTCRGTAPGLASQGMHSTVWPGRARLPSTTSRPDDAEE